MATGACGINCSVCRLNLLGICTTCGSGKSEEGFRKMAAQERILGSACRILGCAIEKKIPYCPRDCDEFPCEQFRGGAYPFSVGYLNMQERRRSEPPSSLSPLGNQVSIPSEYWEELKEMAIEEICKRTLGRRQSSFSLIIPFLNDFILLDLNEQRIYLQVEDTWQFLNHPLMVLLVLVYAINAKAMPLKNEMVSPQQLKTGHFFQGPHELKTRPVLERYGSNVQGFKEAAEKLGGEKLDMGDLSFRFQVFPRIPVYYIFWKGDEEFPPNMNILFDGSIESHLASDAIWGMVNLLSDLLIIGKGLEPLKKRIQRLSS